MTTARGPAFLEQLEAAVPGGVAGRTLDVVDPWIEVAPERLAEVCRWLKDASPVRFDSLQCITAVDWFEPDPKKAAKVSWQPRTELVYHLWSTASRASLVVKVNLPRWKGDVAGQLPEISSVTGVWRGADWHEREVYDLSGVWFNGHPDLRRILCPEDWEGHPLRKDYEMPFEYHGIRGR
ncbi:MAG: NADH-quinone oxidoreductase subunit C [Planctomycetia bacterium]